jgi:hypothetical protein
MTRKTCPCGWPKPLIALMTPSGAPPEGDLVVVAVCPECARPYCPDEHDERDVAELLDRSREWLPARPSS